MYPFGERDSYKIPANSGVTFWQDTVLMLSHKITSRSRCEHKEKIPTSSVVFGTNVICVEPPPKSITLMYSLLLNAPGRDIKMERMVLFISALGKKITVTVWSCDRATESN